MGASEKFVLTVSFSLEETSRYVYLQTFVTWVTTCFQLGADSEGKTVAWVLAWKISPDSILILLHVLTTHFSQMFQCQNPCHFSSQHSNQLFSLQNRLARCRNLANFLHPGHFKKIRFGRWVSLSDFHFPVDQFLYLPPSLPSFLPYPRVALPETRDRTHVADCGALPKRKHKRNFHSTSKLSDTKYRYRYKILEIVAKFIDV